MEIVNEDCEDCQVHSKISWKFFSWTCMSMDFQGNFKEMGEAENQKNGVLTLWENYDMILKLKIS